MVKFEYKSIYLSSLDFTRGETLDKEGIKDWELVTVDNDVAYFKRKKRDGTK